MAWPGLDISIAVLSVETSQRIPCYHLLIMATITADDAHVV